MAKKFKNLRAKMSPERQRRAHAKSQAMLREMLLAELRKHAGKTQSDVAKILGIKQPSVAKLEKQDDMQVNTLGRVVKALGGELELVAHMPDGDVKITQFD